MEEEDLGGVPVLIFANKQDLLNAMKADKVQRQYHSTAISQCFCRAFAILFDIISEIECMNHGDQGDGLEERGNTYHLNIWTVHPLGNVSLFLYCVSARGGFV